MEIRIRYQRRDEATPRVMELSPEEYFEPWEPGETLSVRSAPKLLDTYRYTPHQAEELLWTIVEVIDGESFWCVRTQLLDGMRTLMHHSQQDDGSEEIIHSTELSPRCWHTIRTLKPAGQTWTVMMNSLTVEQPVSLAASRDFCHLPSFEELKVFGRVR